MTRFFVLCSLIGLLGACSGENPVPPPAPPPANVAPSAAAGADFSQQASSSGYALDGSASSDPDNDTLSFAWAIVSQPAGANATLASANSANATFTALAPGEYEFSLTVTDPSGSSDSDTIRVTLLNTPPEPSVNQYSRDLVLGELFSLNATASSDVNDQPLSYSWQLVQAPALSEIPTEYVGGAPAINFDAVGDYRFELAVTDGYETSTLMLDEISVHEYQVFQLTNAFTDAEYDKLNRRVVTVHDEKMFIINADGEETEVALPHAATAVSVSPMGDRTAVGHNGFVSHTDLDAASVLDTYPVPSEVKDIVLDSKGFAHSFPNGSSSFVSIETTNLETGEVELSGSLFRGIIARLHPSGEKIYGASNGVSPDDVERYDLSAGQVVNFSDSPYHGDFPFCGDLWMGPGGGKILTRCRVVVRASDDQNDDMTFDNQLKSAAPMIYHASSSEYNDSWYVLSGSDGSETVSIYDVDSGALTSSLELPYADAGMTSRWFGKFVFGDDESGVVTVLAVDDNTNPQVFAFIKMGVQQTVGVNLPPMAMAPRYATARIGDGVQLDGGGSFDPEGATLSYQWSLLSEPAGSSVTLSGDTTSSLMFQPLLEGAYELQLIVDDGANLSPPRNVMVNVFDTPENLIHRIEGGISDMEYNKTRNEIVYVSAMDAKVYIVSLADFSHRTVALDRMGYRVGISPDGLRAAVSHPGLATLINLETATVISTQSTIEDWGDIVLDRNYRAHFVPVRDQWETFISIEFSSGGGTGGPAFSARADTQLRMHPLEDWVYGADRGLSPSDFEKWDVSAFPSSRLGDSPYHGDFPISGNIWISEDGDRLLVAGGHVFHSNADPVIDMTHITALPDSIFAGWADHSTETNEWAVATTDSGADVSLRQKLVFYDDQTFAQTRVLDFGIIPTSVSVASASHAFYSNDGSEIILLLKDDSLADPFALEVID